jgi:hypothetical protein
MVLKASWDPDSGKAGAFAASSPNQTGFFFVRVVSNSSGAGSSLPHSRGRGRTVEQSSS